MSESFPGAKWVQGTAQSTEAAQNATVIAAQGANTVIRLMKATISVTLAATGGGGDVSLEEGSGGAKIVTVPAAAVGSFSIDFGPRGYSIAANTLLNITSEAATTNEATGRCTAVAYVTP